mmetsp:Transcript_27921/g.67929  ORF Transcript_27921/g.67929 Transcript_27921/m.67929 type:complete len:632 (-) Transcript_27921:188-2083(-)
MVISDTHHSNSFSQSGRMQPSRSRVILTLLCCMALACIDTAEAQAQQTRYPTNRTSHARITTNHINLQAKQQQQQDANNMEKVASLSSNTRTTDNAQWFRIESTSSHQCVAVFNQETATSAEFDTLIHLTDCGDDDDKTLWTQSTDNYYVRSKLNPQKCIVTTGRFLMLKNCPDAQVAKNTNNVRSSSAVVSLPTDAAFEAYDDDTIRLRSNSNKCWQLHEIHKGMIELAACAGASTSSNNERQHWSATTVVENIAQVKKATREAELKAQGYMDWLTIQSKSSEKCIAVEGGQALKLAPIVLKDCDQSDEAQLWTHLSERPTTNSNSAEHAAKIGMIRSKLNPSMCLVPSGSANANVPLILWDCDPEEVFGSWTIYQDDSSIRSTKDPQVCLDTYEYKNNVEDDEFKHDVIVGSCPVDESGATAIDNGQQWVTKAAITDNDATEAKVATTNEAKDEDEDEDEDDEWMTIKSKTSENCITVEGGEALKLAPIVLKPCDQSDDSQLWEHSSARSTENPNQISTKIGMIRSKLNPSMCLVPSGSAQTDVPLVLWDCDPNETFGSWTIYSHDSSIRTTKDPQVCLDTHELDREVEDGDVLKHDVVVGNCPVVGDSSSATTTTTADDSQQWVTAVV